MTTTISNVEVSDIDVLIREIHFPGMQDGPHYRAMFPPQLSHAQQDEIIRWYIENLEEILASEQSCEVFRKISLDGAPVGFCAWTVEQGQGSIQSKRGGEERQRKESWFPETLDINNWVEFSRKIREE